MFLGIASCCRDKTEWLDTARPSLRPDEDTASSWVSRVTLGGHSALREFSLFAHHSLRVHIVLIVAKQQDFFFFGKSAEARVPIYLISNVLVQKLCV